MCCPWPTVRQNVEGVILNMTINPICMSNLDVCFCEFSCVCLKHVSGSIWACVPTLLWIIMCMLETCVSLYLSMCAHFFVNSHVYAWNMCLLVFEQVCPFFRVCSVHVVWCTSGLTAEQVGLSETGDHERLNVSVIRAHPSQRGIDVQAWSWRQHWKFLPPAAVSDTFMPEVNEAKLCVIEPHAVYLLVNFNCLSANGIYPVSQGVFTMPKAGWRIDLVWLPPVTPFGLFVPCQL